MDIQVSSNFERYLFDLADRDAALLTRWMTQFEKSGQLTLDTNHHQQAQTTFLAHRTNEVDTIKTIESFNRLYNYVLDPHTAVGIDAALHSNTGSSWICLATAHPAKFSDAVTQAIGAPVSRPDGLKALEQKPVRKTTLPATVKAIQQFIEEKISL